MASRAASVSSLPPDVAAGTGHGRTEVSERTPIRELDSVSLATVPRLVRRPGTPAQWQSSGNALVMALAAGAEAAAIDGTIMDF